MSQDKYIIHIPLVNHLILQLIRVWRMKGFRYLYKKFVNLISCKNI